MSKICLHKCRPSECHLMDLGMSSLHLNHNCAFLWLIYFLMPGPCWGPLASFLSFPSGLLAFLPGGGFLAGGALNRILTLVRDRVSAKCMGTSWAQVSDVGICVWATLSIRWGLTLSFILETGVMTDHMGRGPGRNLAIWSFSVSPHLPPSVQRAPSFARNLLHKSEPSPQHPSDPCRTQPSGAPISLSAWGAYTLPSLWRPASLQVVRK